MKKRAHVALVPTLTDAKSDFVLDTLDPVERDLLVASLGAFAMHMRPSEDADLVAAFNSLIDKLGVRDEFRAHLKFAIRMFELRLLVQDDD
jgi:hypothetical protein